MVLFYGVQVADVKKNIETAQGASVYPAEQQMLIHQGKVLKDDTTLGENKVAENSFVVIMLSKVRFVSRVLFFKSVSSTFNLNLQEMRARHQENTSCVSTSCLVF